MLSLPSDCAAWAGKSREPREVWSFVDRLIVTFFWPPRASFCLQHEVFDEDGYRIALFHLIEFESSGGVRSGVDPKWGSES